MGTPNREENHKNTRTQVVVFLSYSYYILGVPYVGPKDTINTRILRSESGTQDRVDVRQKLCRILMLI